MPMLRWMRQIDSYMFFGNEKALSLQLKRAEQGVPFVRIFHEQFAFREPEQRARVEFAGFRILGEKKRADRGGRGKFIDRDHHERRMGADIGAHLQPPVSLHVQQLILCDHLTSSPRVHARPTASSQPLVAVPNQPNEACPTHLAGPLFIRQLPRSRLVYRFARLISHDVSRP